MAIKIPYIPEPGDDLAALQVTVRQTRNAVNLFIMNTQDVPGHQFFLLGADGGGNIKSTVAALEVALTKLQNEFEAYKAAHP